MVMKIIMSNKSASTFAWRALTVVINRNNGRGGSWLGCCCYEASSSESILLNCSESRLLPVDSGGAPFWGKVAKWLRGESGSGSKNFSIVVQAKSFLSFAAPLPLLLLLEKENDDEEEEEENQMNARTKILIANCQIELASECVWAAVSQYTQSRSTVNYHPNSGLCDVLSSISVPIKC